MDNVYFWQVSLIQSFKRIIGIRSGEERSASVLFISLFLQGASIALLFTVAISLFLEELPVHELPVVFMVASVFLWTAGWFYARLEHSLPQSKISFIIIGLFTGGVLLLRYGLYVTDSSILLYALLVFFYVAYLLYNLDFWGTTALHYDIRESKRLFALVSAGDIPAKFLGYLAALLLVKQIGTQNLLFLAAGFYLLSVVLVKPSIAKRDDRKVIDHNPHAHSLVHAFRSNGLIRQSALISVFSTAAYILVSFILYGYIKHEFHDQVSLASFIAGLLSAGYILKMFVMFLLTGRLHRWLGVRNALLITPVILILFCIAAFGFSLFDENVMALYFFGAMAVLADILRSAIHYPVMMSGMQVLPVKIRMAGHTVIKGLMDPFAYLIIGAALFWAASGDHVIDFRFLGILLLVMLLGNVITCLPIERFYLDSLASAIRTRNLGSKTIQLGEPEVMRQAKEIIKSGSEDEAVFLLRVLDPEDPGTREIIKDALKHNSAQVRKGALLFIQQQEDHGLNEEVKSVLIKEEEPELIHNMLQILIAEEGTDVLTNYAEHPDEWVRMASMGLLLQYPNHPLYLKAGQKIKELVGSGDPEKIILGLEVLGESGRPGIVTLDQFFSNYDSTVVLAAVNTVGRTRDISVMPHLFPLLKERVYHPDVIVALVALGEAVVQPALDEAKKTKDPKLRRQLLLLLATHDSENASDALFQLLHQWPEDLGLILDHLTDHVHAHTLRGRMSAFIKKLIARAEKLYCLHLSLRQKEGFNLLDESIQQELIRYRDYLLQSIYLEESDPRLKKTFTGLLAGQKDIVASSIELLEQVCGEQEVEGFVRLFEPMLEHERIDELKRAHKFKTFSSAEAIAEILRESDPPYSSWLQALALYAMAENEELLVDRLPAHLSARGSKMVRELIKVLEEQET